MLHRIAGTGLMSFPVVETQTRELRGMIGLHDMIAAEEPTLNEERTRERWLRVRLFGRGSGNQALLAA